MSNPDSGFPALRGGIAKAVFGERYFRMIFWAALRAVSGCAIRERYSGRHFQGDIQGGVAGGIRLRYSGEVFRERFSEGDFTRRYSGAIFGAVFRTAFPV